MSAKDAAFSGSIPALYDEHLVPLLFEPYALDLAERVAELAPRHILETAAGTGAVTAAMAAAVPEAWIIATDLNQAMLDVASNRIGPARIGFRQADAQAIGRLKVERLAVNPFSVILGSKISLSCVTVSSVTWAPRRALIWTSPSRSSRRLRA